MRKIRYLIIALLCTVAQGAWAYDHALSNSESYIRERMAKSGDDRLEVLCLRNDIELTQGPLVISYNMAIHLNGHKLYRSLTTATDDGCILVVNEGVTLTIDGGTCGRSGTYCPEHTGTNPQLTGGNATKGGAILNHGTLVISGITITGNTSTTSGGGIYSDGTMNMKGKTVITGNTGGNLCLAGNSVVTITGALDNDASIGVSLERSNRAFTSGYVTNNGSATANSHFSADIDGASLSLDEGEVKLTAPYDYYLSTESELTNAVTNGTSPLSIKLTADITLSNYVDIPSSKTVTIDLNGHTLDRGLSELTSYGIVIRVENGGTLTVKDSGTGGTITGGYDATGGGICVLGTLNFESGTISGCTGTRGGAIYTTSDGTVNMTGGTITGNTATDGGGIYNNGTLTISGGSITGNTVTEHGGGAVTNYGTLTINGGSFTNNSTVGNGGGIWSNQDISLKGLVNISDNTGRGGTNNLYLAGSTKINVTGALTGSSIGVGMDNYVRKFTSGFSANNSGAAPSDYFSMDDSGYGVATVNNEAYAGIAYWDHEWTGGNTDGHVVSTKRVLTDSYSTITTDELTESGWYVLSGDNVFNDRIIMSNDIKFILMDGSDAEFKKGIRSGAGSTLTIYAQENGTGKIRATGSGQYESAAIGADEDTSGGSLIIHGGTIIASSSENNAAGIGGGDGSSCGMTSITIWDGTITATGKSSGAGIGSGQENGTVPDITIYGGTVTATGGNYAAGIGGGEECSNGTIKIYGGTITATGGGIGSTDTAGGAAGIGSGQDSNQNNPIYIYGGTVNATGGEQGGAGIGGGESGNGGVTNIYGGTVTATGGKYGAGIGGGYHYDNGGNGGTVTISGGTVTATGGKYGAGIGGGFMGNGGTVTINGGTVTVAAGENANAIGHGYPMSDWGTSDGSLSLGNTISVKPNGGSWVGSGNRVSTVRANGTFILQTCTHSGATYTIKDAEYHTIGSCSYCEVSDTDEAHTFGDYGECACKLVSLANNDNNSSTISHWNSETRSVVLTDRTLYKDGNWNTLCLPFDMTAAQVTSLLGDNGTLMELDVTGTYDSHKTGFSDGTLYLYFKNASTITAGKPYIIMWESGDDLENPTFTGVTISNVDTDVKKTVSADDKVSFRGNFDPLNIGSDGDNTKLYLGSGNNLYYPSGTMSINAFRAYFQLHGITAGDLPPQAVRMFFGDDSEQTGITTTNYTNYTNFDNSWYSLDGRKLSGKPTAKGVYIYKGIKRVIK